MFTRPTIRVPSNALQALVNQFTLSQRPWTGYPINNVEHMMHFYNVLPPGFYYARFDEGSEEAVFQSQPFPEDTRGRPLTLERIKETCPLLPATAKLLLSGDV